MKKKTIRILLAVSLCMVLIGSIVGGLIQTSFGTVDVQKVSWVTDDGATLSALLYIPKRASAEEPLPAVVSCHGWNNTAEVQGMNCIEPVSYTHLRHRRTVACFSCGRSGCNRRKRR